MYELQLEIRDNRKFTWFKYVKLQLVSLRRIKVFESKVQVIASKLIAKMLQK